MTEPIRVCTESNVPPRKDVASRMAFMTSRGWGSGHKLTIRFLDGDAGVRKKVEDVAREWTNHADVDFAFVGSGKADIRVSFTPGGSWSLVGKDAQEVDQNSATMNLGWLTVDTPADEYERVVLHEFGHALGCIHEHQHPAAGISWNEPAVYAYYAQLGWNETQVRENIFRKYDQSLVRNTAQPDPLSIMIYAIPKELLLDGATPIDWNRHLSDLDKSFIATLY